MCEGLILLMTGIWEIVRTALGIFLGTAAAWYFFVGPILWNNERRKKNEGIIEGAAELIYGIESKIAEIGENRPPEEIFLSELNQEVDGLVSYVGRKIRSAIADLEDALHEDINKLINSTANPPEFVEDDYNGGRAASLYVDRLIIEVPEICQSLRGTLDEYKQQSFLKFLDARIPHCYEKLKSNPLWQNLVERLR